MIATQKRWIPIIAIVIFLLTYALVPGVKDFINGALAVALGETWVALSGMGASIAGNPIYQQYHALIWVAGGMVLMYGLIRLQIRKRIAEKIHPPQVSVPSPTVVEVRGATPAYATSRPIAETKTEVASPVAEEKKVEETAA